MDFPLAAARLSILCAAAEGVLQQSLGRASAIFPPASQEGAIFPGQRQLEPKRIRKDHSLNAVSQLPFWREGIL